MSSGCHPDINQVALKLPRSVNPATSSLPCSFAAEFHLPLANICTLLGRKDGVRGQDHVQVLSVHHQVRAAIVQDDYKRIRRQWHQGIKEPLRSVFRTVAACRFPLPVVTAPCVLHFQVARRSGLHSVVVAVAQCNCVISVGCAAEHNGGGALPGRSVAY